MKKHLQLIVLAVFFIFVFAFTYSVEAYEAEQLVDCISSAKQNPSIAGVSESSIENYCDCALDLIVDQGKEVRSSGYECAVSNFG